MKNLKEYNHGWFVALAILALSTLNPQLSTVYAQGTAFTYQGQLYNGTNLANGSYDMELKLFTAAVNGSQLGSTITNLGVGVSNGLFTMTVDFGPVITGGSNWLRIDVRTNGGNSFIQLSPRQQLTPTPYAIYAESINSAALSGTYTGAINLNNPANNLAGNGSGLTNLNASQLTSGTVPDAQLANDVALLDVNQTFTGVNIFNASNQSLIIKDSGTLGTNLFSGLGFQFNGGSGESSIVSSFNDGFANLNFYTKAGPGSPILKQMKIDRYGVVVIDQQGNNYGALNDGTTNADGIVFGGSTGEGIASQRTAGVNQFGLDFYTDGARQMSILHNGNIGMGTTNPAAAVDIASSGGLGMPQLRLDQQTNDYSRLRFAPYTNAPWDIAVETTMNFYASGGANGGNVMILQSNGNLSLAGAVSAASFSGSGSGLTGLSASQITSGTVPLARLPGAVVTNNETGITLGNVTLSGSLTLPGTATINSGLSSLLYSDPNGNFFAGSSAGNAPLSSTYNTGIGTASLSSLTSGYGNTALGGSSLRNDTAGFNNTASGDAALFANTTGASNVASGWAALYSNTNGYQNVAVGSLALYANISGGLNVAVGANALGNNTSSENTAVGASALQANTGGYQNTAVGQGALYANKSAGGNTAVGAGALLATVSGGGNTSIGAGSLFYATGVGNIALGNGAGDNITTGNNNIDIGNEGGSSDSGIIRIGSGQSETLLVGMVGINDAAPTEALDIGGEFMVVEGLGGVRCYMGDDGIANDVQVGSLTSGITQVTFFNATDHTNMHITCSGISITGGSDLAEPFPISTANQTVSEGTVVVIDKQNPGHLKMSDQPYDSHVAGVVSGANGINPGIQMQQQGLLEGGRNVALTGRVYVQADASNGPIEPGDLLTTSSAPGRAMKVTDHLKAQGAILGKAMTGLSEGNGMVLVLVTLQ